MSMFQTIQRFYLHFLRYKTVFWISTLFITLIIALFGLFYPGEEVLKEYLTFLAFLGSYDVENPGYSYWILFMDSLLLGAYLQVIGILIGVSVLPREREGKEHLLSSPKSIIKYVIENIILLIILLGIISLPSYIITIVLLIVNNSTDTILSSTIIFVLAITLAIFSAILTSFGTAINFSRSTGYFLGGFYFIFSIFIDLARDIGGLKELRKLSLFSLANITQNSLDETWNLNFIVLTLFLCLLLVIFSVYILIRKDYLEGGFKSSSIEFTAKRETMVNRFLKKLSFIRKPIDKPLGKLSWKFAIFRDQLHSSATYFILILIFITILSAYVLVIYGTSESEMATMLEGFRMPLLDALMYNHVLDPEKTDLLNYFISYELFAFGWILFGIFILIAINDICFRDKKNGYSEITWVTPRSGTRIIMGRTIAALVSYVIIFFASFLAVVIMEIVFGYTNSVSNTIISYIGVVWAYCVLLVFFLSLTFFMPYKHAQKILLFSYLASILILVFGFMYDILILTYFSPFGYFDTVGLMIGDIDFIDFLPSAIIFSLITIVFYIMTIKYRIPAKDYLV